MGKRISQQLGLGGQYTAGDPASAPEGSTKYLQNYLTRPGRLPSRPPFKYDGQMAVNGLANFDDQTHKVQRLVAINTDGEVFVKSSVQRSEGWEVTSPGTISGNRLSGYANYRGSTYMMFDNGIDGLPSGAAVYDGTTLSTSPFTSAIAARAVTVFNERLHLSYPRMAIPVLMSAADDAYDWATLGPFTVLNKSNVTVSKLVDGSTKTVRVFPTSLAANACSIYTLAASGGTGGFVTLPSSNDPRPVVWQQGIRPVDAVNTTPITLSLSIAATFLSVIPQIVTAGDLIDRGGYLYKCTTPGTLTTFPVVEPTWNTTVGGTTTWDGVIFTNIGSTVLKQLEFDLPSASDVTGVQTYSLTADIPAILPSTVANLNIAISFHTSARPALTALSPIDISYRDGYADGDSRKNNFGTQITLGSYGFPFFNQESSLTVLVDSEEEIWSEVGLPTVFLATSTYKLREGSGHATASWAIGGRKLTFKRDAFWQFQATGLDDIPIRKEKMNEAIGCIGSLALDTFEDVVYFIGENDIYAYSVKDDAPSPICGDGMREVVMDGGDNWVENLPSLHNRPILKIDQSRLIMWVYTQKGKLFAYDLRSKMWSTHLVSSEIEIDGMEWNANTGNFYVAFASESYGLTRMDYTTSGQDVIQFNGANLPVERVIEFRPIELTDPARYDAYCEGMQILYKASGAQDVELAISGNQGAAYPNTVDYTTVSVSTDGDFVPMTLDVCELGASTTLKLTTTGDTGEDAWSLSTRAMVKLEIMRGEYPQTNPTAGAANL